MDEIKNCGSPEEKIFLIKRHVHSLADWIEIVNGCIPENERIAVFKLLHDSELSVILKHLFERKGEELFGRSLNSDWENAFLDYLNNLGEARLKFIRVSVGLNE